MSYSFIHPEDLTVYRAPLQNSEIFLVKYEPNIVLQARINNPSIENGAITIAYDNLLVTGSYLNVEDGMTCYVGTTLGGSELGRVRVRSATINTLTVAPDSDIQYVDNAYLTVKDFYEFWPVFPRAVLNTGTLTYTFYKDNDIVLSDQNTNFDPVVVMGPHFAGFYHNRVTVEFSATGSYTVDGSTLSSYSWEFPTGCNPATSTSASPGLVSFPEPGMYTVKCSIVSSTGKTGTSYRHIALMDRDVGDHLPISDWELDTLEGEWGVGWNCKVKVRERANEFKDGDLVILFSEDNYLQRPEHNPLELTLTHKFAPHRHNLLFVGYVHYVENQYDFADSESMIFLKGISSYMQNKEMFSIELMDKPTGYDIGDWTHIRNMDLNKVINHYFRWHSTLYKMTDVRPIETPHGSYDENIVQIQKGEIYSSINNLLKQRMFGVFTSDAIGVCYPEVDLNMIATGSRPGTTLELIDTDWVGTPTIIERIEQPISNVLLGGETYRAGSSTETGTAYLSRAPGELQTYTGKSENVSGITLPANGQTEINKLSGLYYAKENNRIPELTLDMAINIRTIDIAPQAFYGFTIEEPDLHRGLVINPRLIPRKITRKFEDFVIKSNIYFETETYGPPGDTIIIPVEAPNGDTDCEDDPDNCNPPCANGCDEDPPSTNPQGATVFVATRSHLARTHNFLDASPNWEDITGGVAGATIVDFNLDPFDPSNKAILLTDTVIYKTSNLSASSPTWTNVGSNTDFSVDNFSRVLFTIAQQDRIYVLANDRPSDWHRYVLRSSNGGSSWTIGADAGTEGQATGQYWGFAVGNHNPNVVYVSRGAGGNDFCIKRSEDGGATWCTFAGSAAQFNSAPDIECPYAGNDVNDLTIYIWSNVDDGALYRIVGTNCSTSTATALTPVGSDSEGLNVPYRILVATDTANRIYVIRQSSGITYKLDRSDDGGDTWTQNIQTLTHARGLGGWPFDSDRMEILMNDENDGDKLRIYNSTDAGETLTDKIGDWNSSVGGLTSLGVRIIPLWTE
jgi:hypothetical protein